MRKLLVLAAVVSLSACSTIQEMYTDVPGAVAKAQSTLATAEDTARIYAALPVCGTSGATLCHNPIITAQIAAADNTAFNAVEAAHTAETQDALDAAMTALNALTGYTSNLQVTAN